MKQTFSIPDGYKTVSVEQIGNQLITSFEPEKYVPKKGDFVRVISHLFGNNFIFECAGINKGGEPLEAGDTIFNGVIAEKDDIGHCIASTYTKLTPEEFQAEFDKLGYVYDFETHTAKKKRKRVDKGSMYYYADSALKACKLPEQGDDFDDDYFESGNYFETEEDCQKYCDYMRECSLNFHTNKK